MRTAANLATINFLRVVHKLNYAGNKYFVNFAVVTLTMRYKHRCFIQSGNLFRFWRSGGAVIRDESGRILGTTAKFYDHVPDVLTAEALAARDGLLLARAGGFEKLK